MLSVGNSVQIQLYRQAESKRIEKDIIQTLIKENQE